MRGESSQRGGNPKEEFKRKNPGKGMDFIVLHACGKKKGEVSRTEWEGPFPGNGGKISSSSCGIGGRE